MPCRYVIDKERRLVISTASDRVTFAEANAHQDQLKNDPDFDPKFNQLLNFTAVTALEMSTEEAKMMARRTFFSPGSRRAFVATNPDVFGMGRLMGAHDEIARARDEVGVFYDLEKALKWLGLGQCIMRERPC